MPSYMSFHGVKELKVIHDRDASGNEAHGFYRVSRIIITGVNGQKTEITLFPESNRTENDRKSKASKVKVGG